MLKIWANAVSEGPWMQTKIYTHPYHITLQTGRNLFFMAYSNLKYVVWNSEPV